MAQKSGNSKAARRNPHSGRSRGSEIKTGNKGARRNKQSHADLIRMGKGAAKSMKHVKCTPWQGATTVTTPFDPIEAARYEASQRPRSSAAETFGSREFV